MRRTVLAVALLGVVALLAIGAWALPRLRGGEPSFERRDAAAVDKREVTRFQSEPPPLRPMGRAGPPPAPDPDAPPGSPDRVDGPPKEEMPGEGAPADPRDAGPAPLLPADPEGIKKAIAMQSDEVRACYQTLLADHPDAAGRVVVAFVIDTDGRVAAADIDDTTVGSVYLEGCLVTAMEDLTFEPPTDGEVTVTYPFVFRAE